MISANWHVVVGVAGTERATAQALAKLDGVQAGFCPMRRVSWYRNRKLVNDLTALVPRILFAKWETLDPHLWHDVVNTGGVQDILRGGAQAENDRWIPSIVRVVDIGRWLDVSDIDWVVPNLSPITKDTVLGFGLNDQVKIVSRDGIYDGITGECVWFDSFLPPKITAVQSSLGRVYVPVEMVERDENSQFSFAGRPLRAKSSRARQRQNSLRKQALKRHADRLEVLANGTL